MLITMETRWIQSPGKIYDPVIAISLKSHEQKQIYVWNMPSMGYMFSEGICEYAGKERRKS